MKDDADEAGGFGLPGCLGWHEDPLVFGRRPLPDIE